MECKQTGWEYFGWIYLAQARDRWQTTANAEMNLWVLWSAKNFFSSGSPVSFARTTYFLAVSFESNFQQNFPFEERAIVRMWSDWIYFSLETIQYFFIHRDINNAYPMTHSGGTTEHKNVCFVQETATQSNEQQRV
jgi:hypothetical protein